MAAVVLALKVKRFGGDNSINTANLITNLPTNFKQYLTRQDEILTEFWKRFGVYSLTGNWDYRESALFGYAA